MGGESTGSVTYNAVAKGTLGQTVSSDKGKQIPQRCEANPEQPSLPTMETTRSPALWRSRLKGQSASEEINTDMSESVSSMSISKSVEHHPFMVSVNNDPFMVYVDTDFALPGYTETILSPNRCPSLPPHEYTMLETPPSMNMYE